MAKKNTDPFHEQAEKLAQLTFILARACEQKELYFTKLFDLTNAEFRLMRFLKDNCYLSVKELAKVMDLTPGRITQIITSLEKKEYITREIDTNDRRNIKTCITQKAVPFIKIVVDQHVKLHEDVLLNIPEQTRESVLYAMEELLRSMQAWSKRKESD
jgi:DNA-binding MarR family transcriptional regulator